jgi:hypothetical protein
LAALVVHDQERVSSVRHDLAVPTESFPSEVRRRLGWYVYRLIDPRNGETFYVAKGQGNRVFAHVHAAAGLEGDDLDNKVKRIRQREPGSRSSTPPRARHPITAISTVASDSPRRT